MVTISFPLYQSREVPVQPPNIQLVPIHMLSAINMGTKGQVTCYCGASDMEITVLVI